MGGGPRGWEPPSGGGSVPGGMGHPNFWQVGVGGDRHVAGPSQGVLVSCHLHGEGLGEGDKCQIPGPRVPWSVSGSTEETPTPGTVFEFPGPPASPEPWRDRSAPPLKTSILPAQDLPEVLPQKRGHRKPTSPSTRALQEPKRPSRALRRSGPEPARPPGLSPSLFPPFSLDP